MPTKKKFVLRVDERTMAAVEKWAADEFRSVNGQLEWIITKALKEAKRYKPSRIIEVPKQEDQIKNDE